MKLFDSIQKKLWLLVFAVLFILVLIMMWKSRQQMKNLDEQLNRAIKAKLSVQKKQ